MAEIGKGRYNQGESCSTMNWRVCGFGWFRSQTGKTASLKAILRLTRKLNLLSVIRRRRPYVRYQQVVYKYQNLLSR